MNGNIKNNKNSARDLNTSINFSDICENVTYHFIKGWVDVMYFIFYFDLHQNLQ